MSYVPGNLDRLAEGQDGGPDWRRYCEGLALIMASPPEATCPLGLEGQDEFHHARQRLDVSDMECVCDSLLVLRTGKAPTWLDHLSRRMLRGRRAV